MSDTPRTDAAYFAPASTIDDIARAMRQLELELAAANERIRRLEQEALDIARSMLGPKEAKP